MSPETNGILGKPTFAQPKWATSWRRDLLLYGTHSRQKVILIVGALWMAFSLILAYRYFYDTTCTIAYGPNTYGPRHSDIPIELMLGEDGVQLSLQEYEQRRLPDVTDAFKDFRKHKTCNFSSLDLHTPFAPLCTDRKSLLEAMTSGGRVGVDAPYAPKGCDMRWFSTAEICAILSRFEEVFVMGDSLMRGIATASNVLLREDLYQGAWNISRRPAGGMLPDCNCGGTIAEHGKCDSWRGAASSTKLLWDHDPTLIKCPRKGTAAVELVKLLAWPLWPQPIDDFLRMIKIKKPQKPYAFVFGTGLWNDANVKHSENWIDQVFEAVERRAPYLTNPKTKTIYPRLYISPSAAGPNKPPMFWAHQGNVALMRFEKELGKYIAAKKGIDFLGTFNLTIQTNNPDGTHGTFTSTITKAMMMFNWLNMIDTDAW